MVYLVESKRGSRSYFYLVENFKIARGQRRQFRKYVGSGRPSKARLEILSAQFKEEIESEKLKLFGYHYLFPEEIKKIDEINAGFKERYVKLNPTEREQFDQNFVNVFVYNSNSIEGSTLTPFLTFSPFSLNQQALSKKQSLNLRKRWTGTGTKSFPCRKQKRL
jgi:hypothetical protein